MAEFDDAALMKRWKPPSIQAGPGPALPDWPLPPALRPRAWRVTAGSGDRATDVADYLRGGAAGMAGEWAAAELSESGELSGAFGVAVAEVAAVECDVRMARLSGAALLFVDGEAFAGDPERRGFGGVPVALRKGANELAVFGVEGGFDLELWAPATRLVIATWDLWLPRAEHDGWAENDLPVPIVNAAQVEADRVCFHFSHHALDVPGLAPKLAEWQCGQRAAPLALLRPYVGLLARDPDRDADTHLAHPARRVSLCAFTGVDEGADRKVVRIRYGRARRTPGECGTGRAGAVPPGAVEGLLLRLVRSGRRRQALPARVGTGYPRRSTRETRCPPLGCTVKPAYIANTEERSMDRHCVVLLAGLAAASPSVFPAPLALGKQLSGTSVATVDAVPEGLTATDWSMIREAYEADRHAVSAADVGHRARNPGQGWTTHFDGQGFTTTPDVGEWTWGLELVSFAWGDDLRTVSEPQDVTAEASRIAYAWDELVTEWYVNDRRGLEHGYTLHSRPAEATGPVTLSLAIRGSLVALVSENGRDVRFVDSAGNCALDYAGLTVLDADGLALAAGWQVASGGLELSIDDQAARYPLTIDPLAQQAYLKASNTSPHTFFGASVAVSGDTVVAGAEYEASNATGVNGDGSNFSAPGAGAAYVFVRNGTNWTKQAYLKASNTGAGDGFGHSVAISGDTIVVGAVYEASNATGVNGNGSDNSAYGAGAAYVFVRNGTTWSQQAYLKASNPELDDSFGYAVAVSGDTIVVGANFEASNAQGVNGNQADNSAAGAGAAYVFVRSGTSWSQQAYLKASNTDSLDLFGNSVSVSDDTVVVGAYAEDSSAKAVNGNQANNSAMDAGAVYVFVRSGTSWSQQAYLKASNTDPLDGFGYSVAVGGDTLVVGSPSESSSATGVNGHQNDNSLAFAGAAYVFVRNGTSWSQQAYLKASNTGAGDQFGQAVAVDGDMAVCGAYPEDSAATGVNGDGTNNSAPNSGAAYVFARSGTNWSQSAYLKSSNTETGDLFGVAVSVSGTTVVVGALFEDSSATGVNGDPSNNNSTDSGAAYVFDVCTSSVAVTPYGVGKPGTVGSAALSSTNPPKLNTTADVTITGGLAGASPVLLFVGFAPAAIPFDGGTLLVNPAAVVALPPLSGSGSLVLPVPLTTWACGAHVYFQAMFVDPGASGPYHTVQSNGLDWTIGG